MVKIETAQNLRKSVFHVRYRKQWRAAISIHVLSLVHGINIGWLSPILLRLQSENSPLSFPLSVTEASWIGTSWGIGSLTGTIIIGLLMECIGRKFALLFLALPHLSSWALAYFAQSIEYLYLGRFMGGVTGGALFTLMPIYSSEIADQQIRGALTAILMTILSVGMLLGFILASYVDYFLIPCITVWFSVVYICAVALLPETPQQLLRKGHAERALKSYLFYKNLKNDSDNEETAEELRVFEELKNEICKGQPNSDVHLRDFITKSALKSFATAIVILSCNQFSGCFSMSQYMSFILTEAGTPMDANLGTVIIGMVQIIGTISGILLVDKLGRRCLLLSSIVGMGLGWVSYGLFAELASADVKARFFWIPLVIMTWVVFIASAGILGIISLVVVEAFSAKIRSKGTAIVMIYFFLVLSLQLKIYPVMLYGLGVGPTMYITGSVCFISVVYLLFFMEETKNKSTDFDH